MRLSVSQLRRLDYDIAPQSTLITVRRDRQEISAVAWQGKRSWFFCCIARRERRWPW